MERVLLVMRHAKSSWSGGFSDHDRPLNDRGRRAAPTMGVEIARRGWLPDLAFVSDATRTVETWERMTSVWPDRPPAEVLSSLYLPSVETWIRAAASAPDAVRTLLVLTHNPASEDVVRRLTGQAVELKTATVAQIAFTGRWAELGVVPASLVEVVGPRDGD